MAIILSGIGKGLYEPCSPNRRAYFFGAELNSVSASGWNCPPNFTDPTNTFDLAPISKNREVAAALIWVPAAKGDRYQCSFKWYRERDNKLLFEGTWEWTAKGTGIGYFYSFIGWTDWEINEDGAYRVDINLLGPIPDSRSISFTITGVHEVTPPERIPTGFMAPIIAAFNTISGYCYAIGNEMASWVIPFSWTADWFLFLGDRFNDIAWAFYDFSEWIAAVTDLIGEGINWDAILGLVIDWLRGITDLFALFPALWENILEVIGNWWTSAMGDVQGWIDDLKIYLEGRVDNLNSLLSDIESTISYLLDQLPSLNEIITWFTDWWGNILAQLTAWWDDRLLDIQDLIDSAFLLREGFWGGWQDWRDQVTEFFTDPYQWIYDRLDEFFERFW